MYIYSHMMHMCSHVHIHVYSLFIVHIHTCIYIHTHRPAHMLTMHIYLDTRHSPTQWHGHPHSKSSLTLPEFQNRVILLSMSALRENRCRLPVLCVHLALRHP